jgi:hypothetical protein
MSDAPLSSPHSAALAHLALKSRQNGANESILQNPQNRLSGAHLRTLQAAEDVGLGRHLLAGVFQPFHQAPHQLRRESMRQALFLSLLRLLDLQIFKEW